MSLLSTLTFFLCLLSQSHAFSTPTRRGNEPAAMRMQEPWTWKDMPRKASEGKEAPEALEIAIGRVAMVGSVLFLAEEVLTGESILEQMIHTAHVLVHTV